MKKLNVAVIYGGDSPEHMISRTSANNIISKLSTEKYNIIPIYINKEGSWIMYDNYTSDLNDWKWEKIGEPISISFLCLCYFGGLMRLSRYSGLYPISAPSEIPNIVIHVIIHAIIIIHCQIPSGVGIDWQT